MRHDWALLKIDAVNLPALTVGASHPADLKPTSEVRAVGFPSVTQEELARNLELKNGPPCDVAKGFVSSFVPDDSKPYCIVHSCPIQKGNSGGPLLNAKGEVVGINTQSNSDEIGNHKSLAIAIQTLASQLESQENTLSEIICFGRRQPAAAGRSAKSPPLRKPLMNCKDCGLNGLRGVPPNLRLCGQRIEVSREGRETAAGPAETAKQKPMNFFLDGTNLIKVIVGVVGALTLLCWKAQITAAWRLRQEQAWLEIAEDRLKCREMTYARLESLASDQKISHEMALRQCCAAPSKALPPQVAMTLPRRRTRRAAPARPGKRRARFLPRYKGRSAGEQQRGGVPASDGADKAHPAGGSGLVARHDSRRGRAGTALRGIHCGNSGVYRAHRHGGESGPCRQFPAETGRNER